MSRVARVSGETARAVSRFVSTDKNQTILNYARIRGRYLIATDGKVLAHLPLETALGDPVEAEVEYKVPRSTLRRPKRWEYLDVDLSSGEIEVRKRNGGELVASLPRLEEPEEDEVYPDTDHLLAAALRDEVTARFAIQPQLLKTAAALVDSLENGSVPGIVFEVRRVRASDRSTDRAVVFRAKNRREDPLGVVMPIRLFDATKT